MVLIIHGPRDFVTQHYLPHYDLPIIDALIDSFDLKEASNLLGIAGGQKETRDIPLQHVKEVLAARFYKLMFLLTVTDHEASSKTGAQRFRNAAMSHLQSHYYKSNEDRATQAEQMAQAGDVQIFDPITIKTFCETYTYKVGFHLASIYNLPIMTRVKIVSLINSIVRSGQMAEKVDLPEMYDMPRAARHNYVLFCVLQQVIEGYTSKSVADQIETRCLQQLNNAFKN